MPENPYHACLMSLSDDIRQLDPETLRARHRQRPRHARWAVESEWVYREMANVLLAGAYLSTTDDPGRWGRDTAAQFAEQYIETLVTAAVDDRWYHGGPGMGDRNLDRFVGVPLLEAYRLVGDLLSEPLRERFERLVRALLRNQYHEYGSGSGREAAPEGDPKRATYANMDVYYALLMAQGYHITGDAYCRDEAQYYLRLLADVQFEDGAWPYIYGTNECPTYHTLNVIGIARAGDLMDEPAATAQLDKSRPYYPITVMPTGVMEFHTSCSWKHGMNWLGSFAPDLIASRFDDGENRAVADLVRDETLERVRRAFKGLDAVPIHGIGLFTVMLAWHYRDVPASPLPARGVFFDRNIDGPRAHFHTSDGTGWSWAATAREASDTLVGAMMHTPRGEPACALLAVMPEIAYRYKGLAEQGNARWALANTPPGTCGETRIDGSTATFEATYRMAAYKYINFERYPHDWQCTQHWTLDEDAMHGRIEVRSRAAQHSPPPLVRLRFGCERELVEAQPGVLRYGDLTVELHEHTDFPVTQMRTHPHTPGSQPTGTTDLLLYTGRGVAPGSYAADQAFQLELTVKRQRSDVPLTATGAVGAK